KMRAQEDHKREEEKRAQKERKRAEDNINREQNDPTSRMRNFAKKMGAFDQEIFDLIQGKFPIPVKNNGRELKDSAQLARKTFEEKKRKEPGDQQRARQEQKNQHKDKPKTK